MSMETEVLLRTILYQLKMTDSIEEVRIAVEAMCSDDAVAAVEKKVTQAKSLRK